MKLLYIISLIITQRIRKTDYGICRRHNQPPAGKLLTESTEPPPPPQPRQKPIAAFVSPVYDEIVEYENQSNDLHVYAHPNFKPYERLDEATMA